MPSHWSGSTRGQSRVGESDGGDSAAAVKETRTSSHIIINLPHTQERGISEQ